MRNLVFLLSFWSRIGDAIAGFFFGILLWFNAIIYSFVSYVYQIFLVLANGGNIIDGSIIEGLISRVYTIIGVVVLFLVAYSILKSMVNPDEALKGKKSPIKIIKDVIISIALIAFVPMIFDFAFKAQTAILSYNTIGKIIAGSPNGDSENTIRMGGYNMASTIWQTFLIVGDEYCTPEQEKLEKRVPGSVGCKILENDEGESYGSMWQEAADTTSFFSVRGAVDFIVNDQITYIFIIDILCGAFALFVLITYCFDMALRLVKLAVFELIAPLPILARIVPSENKIFDNWIKATLSTFIEVFIRIAILYFAVIIISTVGTSIDNIFSSASYTNSATLPLVIGIAKVLVIMGIVMFVKQAPNIIKEITGLDGGKYNVLKSAKQGFSLIAGGVTGRSLGAAWRSYNDAGDAKLGDFSTIGNQYKRRLAKQEAKNIQKQAGMKWYQRAGNNFTNKRNKFFGFPTLKEAADANLEKFKDLDGDYMHAQNDTGMDIRDANGNIVVANGSQMELNEANVNRLNEAKAHNNLAKSEIQEQVNKFNGVVDNNKAITDFKGRMEDIAKGEFQKGKFYLTDAAGNNLELSYNDASGASHSFGASGATQKELESWLEANRERMSGDDFAKLSARLNKSINDWSVTSFVNTNGMFNGSENADIKVAKRDFVQTYQQGHIYEVNASGEVVVNNTQDARVGAYAGREETLDWDTVKDVKDTAKTINDEVGLRVNSEKIRQGNIDSANSAIDRVLNQGKEQVEAQKSTSQYKAYEASDKAQNINNQAKNG